MPDKDSNKDLEYCTRWLAEERVGARDAEGLLAQATSDDELFSLYRALANTREPDPVPDEWLTAQDRMLRARIASAGVTDARDLPRTAADQRISLWRGDITRLRVDAIVNAANSQMLGCWVPGHHCIDNAIHTFAGVQLRAKCARIMAAQGHEEPTAQAKITPAYNLPARYVIHTVGPIAQGRPTARHRMELARCYRACLEAAVGAGCTSIAFCCISTGVFGFPQEEAAQIAVRTVSEWLDEHVATGVAIPTVAAVTPAAGAGPTHVVFNVFTPRDEAIYRDLLG